MGAQSDSKKVSISSANPIVISNVAPVSEPSATLYLSVVISLLGAIGIGFVIGYMSPVIDKITTSDQTNARSWMGSIMPLGALYVLICILDKYSFCLIYYVSLFQNRRFVCRTCNQISR